MRWTMVVSPRSEMADPIGQGVKASILDLGIDRVEDVRVSYVYLVEGNFSAADAERICREVLADPVTEEYRCNDAAAPPKGWHAVHVFPKPGVMDPVALTTLKAISDMGLKASEAKTGKRYLIKGRLAQSDLDAIADEILHNEAIEEVHFHGELPEAGHPPKYRFERIEVPILDASNPELEKISERGQLSLNLAEMKTIQAHYKKMGRNPTDVELETLAQTWSEHCVHKTLRGLINCDGKKIDNLLKSTVMRATKELNKPWCVSVFKDNAGIIRFDETYDVCFKVETHNHPSAIEPYGGAATGTGGVIRDPLGTGMGAKPILCTDIFCFGPPDLPHADVPPGALHPKRVFRGVVAGVRDYGNRMGIPTANGAIYFDERYIGNPLVYCGNLGLIPHDKAHKEPKKGDLVVVVGGRTGRDGIHGATFSSVELHEESEVMSSGAVQIGNPITEKKMVDTLLQARDRGLYHCITDCGAGGLSSAVGEMGEELGAEVDLEKVPLKYEGLSYTEIWISEAQERMVLAVPSEKEREILALFAAEDVEATTIGRFTGTGRLVLRYEGNEVADMDMEFLHDGLPRLERKAVWQPQKFMEPKIRKKKNYGGDLKKILSAWNVCSKEWVIRQYDHEVQGASVLKPLVGVMNDGPGDACIIRPVLGSNRGVIVSCGMNPKYSDIDPYHMAASAIDEAVRQVIAVGGSLGQTAILDNFCWGNTNKPDRVGGLVRAAQACYDVAVAYGTPFISGKDSLNNEFRVGDKTTAIPGTLLISAVAVMPDVTKAVSMDAKEPGNLIYVVGLTKNELGASHYFELYRSIGNDVPKVDAHLGKRVFDGLARATGRRLVRSCHDCSEGGIAVAAAEMAFAGGRGMKLSLSPVPRTDDVMRDDQILFSESNSRFIVEVKPKDKEKFEKTLGDIPFAQIGEVTKGDIFEAVGLGKKPVIREKIADLKESWQAPLRW
ncbi:MAG: phosphoribosylformylglycinamidine synthase subunit PurL [Planctomycetota bacterium]